MNNPNCTFSTSEPALSDLLLQIARGEVQLPDFQRGWVWDDNHIRSLVASVSMSYPIGAVMLLETGGNGVRFKPRPLEGTAVPNQTTPIKLILDGQQRLTSLFLTMKGSLPVPTKTEKDEPIQRVYFLDIGRCLKNGEDRMDAVRSVPQDLKVTSDFGRKVDLDVSTQEREFELGFIPLNILFDQNRYNAWRRGYQQKYRQDTAKLDLFDTFETEVCQRFLQYRVPTIELKKETPKEAVCQVFEKVNTGGVTLTVFELLTATFAADDYNLRDDWDSRLKRLRSVGPISEIEATDFLTSLTLLASYKRSKQKQTAVSCKRKDVLNLTLQEYRENADALEKAFINAARLLIREKVFDARNLPYQGQLVPLAAICAILGEQFEQDTAKRKLMRWFWCGVFGELYGGANESRYAFDVQEVVEWIAGNGDEPRTIRDANFAPVRLLSLQSRLSAAYKGLMVQLMQQGSLDFINGDPIELTTYFDLAVDIHHIFPQAHCEAKKYPRSRWNSIVNKAPLTSRTNRVIGGRAPSIYLGTIQKAHQTDAARLDTILESHLIVPTLLRKDNFDDFLRERAAALLGLVERATGKQVSGRDSEEVRVSFGGPLMGDQVIPPPTAVVAREPQSDQQPDYESSTQGDGETGEHEMSQRCVLRQRFWTEFLNRAKEKMPFQGNVSPGQRRYLCIASIKPGLRLNCVILKHQAEVELYIDRGKDAERENKDVFTSLAAAKNAIENDFGEPLDWDQAEGKRCCRVSNVISMGGYQDGPKWEAIEDAMIDAMVRLERALKPHIAKLQL